MVFPANIFKPSSTISRISRISRISAALKGQSKGLGVSRLSHAASASPFCVDLGIRAGALHMDWVGLLHINDLRSYTSNGESNAAAKL
jgi:hypothetical protein